MSSHSVYEIELSDTAKVQRISNWVSGGTHFRVRVQVPGRDATWTDFEPTPELEALFRHASDTDEVYPLLDKLADTNLTEEVQFATRVYLDTVANPF